MYVCQDKFLYPEDYIRYPSKIYEVIYKYKQNDNYTNFRNSLE